MDTAYAQYAYPLLPNRYFCSYYYKRNTEKVLSAVPEGFQGVIFVDSGAHSFFGSFGLFDNVSYQKDESRRATLVEITKYFDAYFEWIKQWYSKISYFAELDLQEIVGLDLVMAWRRKFIQAGMGGKLVTAFHYGDSDRDFQWQLDNSLSGYVATQGIRQGKSNINHKKYVKMAYDAGVRIHGFAMTKKEVIMNIPFYSVDSSSWTSCWKFGTIFKFDGREMKRIANSDSSRSRILKYGIGAEHMGCARGREEIRIKAIYAEKEWRSYECYIEELWRRRGIDWDRQIANRRTS
jgi:hypothetical protein